VYEDDLWSVRGRYEAGLEENEVVDWSVLNHQFTLKLLIVSLEMSLRVNLKHI
jgi:hypothetical protein